MRSREEIIDMFVYTADCIVCPLDCSCTCEYNNCYYNFAKWLDGEIEETNRINFL